MIKLAHILVDSPQPAPILSAAAIPSQDSWWDSERPEPSKLRTIQQR